MKLYYFETPNPRKPCAVAKYLESPVEFVRIDLAKGEHQTPEYLAINPNGKVPALVDGDINLWESHAIMAHLAVQAGSDLWPSDSGQQIEVLRWLLWDVAHFSRHAGTLFFERVIKPNFGRGEPDQAAIEEATGFFVRFAGVLDDHLANHDYMVADRLTIVDFGLSAMLPNATEAQLPLDGRDNIAAWLARLGEIDAWANPWPEAKSAVA